MKNRPYYFEIKNLITQFISAFNDIAIKRYDKDKADSGALVGVGFMYAPKQRVIEDLINKSRAIALPVISVNIASITRDAERVFNKIDGSIISTSRSADVMRMIPQPVPINIVVNMSIIARYQADIEQIISNFVPYCDPYITVSWKLPTTENTTYEREIRTIIEWGGSLNMQYPVELSSSQLARVTCDTTFTIKGWIFKQISLSVGEIYKVNTSFQPSLLGEECIVFNNIGGADNYDTAPTSDYFTLHGKPRISSIDKYMYAINGTGKDNLIYNIYGHNFQYTTGVYFKTLNLSPIDTTSVFDTYQTIDLFKDTKYAGTYPAFDGWEIINFTIHSPNNISFTINPTGKIVREGHIDIVVANPAGYSTLARDTYMPGVAAELQLPYSNGIKVFSI